MNIVIRRLLNYDSCGHAKPLILRLCKKSCCTISVDSAWKKKTLITFHRFSERYKYFFQYRKCTNFATQNIKREHLHTNAKIYEHKLMYALLQNSVHYANTIIPPVKVKVDVTLDEIEKLYNANWLIQPPQYILDALKKLMYCHLNGTQFENELFNFILEACNDKLSEFDSAQIKKLMQCLIVLTDFLKESHIYLEFMKNLSNQCLKQFFSSNYAEMLLLVDAFYQLNVSPPDYVWRALRKIGTKPHKLSSKQLIQFLFYSSLYNTPNLNMFEIQCSLEECLFEFTGNEIGILARGFFLNKTRISNQNLMKKIIKKVIKNVSNIDNIAIASIMKLIRYSNCYHCFNDVSDLIVALRTELPRLSIFALTHITHTMGAQQRYNKLLLDDICARVEKEMKLMRIKDIERTLYTLCTVTPYTEYHDICNKLLNELISSYKTTRSIEIQDFRKSLPRVIVFLTYKNIYSRELIEYVFNPEFVIETYKYDIKLLSNEFLILNCSAKIELPDYKGPFLDDKLYSCSLKKFCSRSDTYMTNEGVKLQNEIVYICKEILRLNVYTDMILPHYYVNDIIFGFDEYNNSISVESILSKMPFGSIKRVDTEDLKKIKWKVVYILINRHKVTGHDGYIGAAYAKFRQLKTIGYAPIPISSFKWNSLSTDDQKYNFLKEQIFQSTDSNFLVKGTL
ncbi:FAST kinase domain-containing protein 5, mitochondrial [Calliopsis andreniformis]|uniref:FAST kinase domain-containing protein 5, mitochondrial n=1 Tax=Calliopsis andreniformis TaxID=337506 RepID=UPI003FCE05FC